MSTCSASLETQGQIVGTRECLNGRKNIYGTKKSKKRREEPLGTMSYQTSSKQSLSFWLLIGARKLVFFWHQSEARMAATIWNWSGKTLAYCFHDTKVINILIKLSKSMDQSFHTTLCFIRKCNCST